MAETFANNATTTLGAAISSSGATSITVTSSTPFPATGQFRVLIDSEILLVTAVSGVTWTVTRGVESTTATTHSNGATITHILTAGALAQLKTDALPTIKELDGSPSGNPATLKFPNGTLIDNGDGSYTHTPRLVDNLGQSFTPPTSSTFGTWVNQGIAVITDADGYVRLSSAAETTDSWHMRSRSLPSAPYTLEFGLFCNLPPANFGGAAIGWREASSGKIILCVRFFNSSASPGPGGYVYSVGDNIITPAGFALTANRTSNVSAALNLGEWPYWRLRDDNTNRYWEMSQDRKNWMRFYSEGRTTPFTPDQIVIGVEARNAANHEVSLDILHYVES